MRNFILIVMSFLLSTQLHAEVNWIQATVDFTSSKLVTIIVKKAGLGSAEAILVSTIIEEVVTEENVNAVAEFAKGEKARKAYRTDLGRADNSTDFPSGKYVAEFRNY